MKNLNRRSRRRTLRRLRDLISRPVAPQLPRRNNPFRFETLEGRMMLAGDLGLDPTLADLSGPVTPDDVPAITTVNNFDSAAEGEDTPEIDLVAFAKALADSGARLFGAAWCPACTTQKELFEDGGDFLPFVEVSNPDRTQNQIGIDENITAYPTWEFGDGSREVGVLSLEAIAQRAEISIPTSTQPFIAPLEDRILFAGSPLHIALNGYDPNGGELTYTIESSNPGLVTPTLLQGNRSASIYYSGWGEVVVQLFEGRAPDATGQFITLADSGFYDVANNDPPIIVHRSINNFMMQFGDPLGNGTGGSTLDDFDDDFHVELQHNSKGILSWAKGGDDTNNSQVFITDTATRWLDFNHSVFGLVTEGDKVRDAITGTATDASNRPLYPITLGSVTVFGDEENGVVMLSAPEGIASPTDVDITVTAEDLDGNQYVETFTVTVQPDPYNGGPFLTDLPEVISTTVGTPAVIQLDSIDVENDTVVYDGVRVGSVNYTVSVNNQTGAAVITPPAGFVGSFEVLFRVSQLSESDTDDDYDGQFVTIDVTPAAPLSIDLLTSSDSGISLTDNITNETNPEFEISGVLDGATVTLYDGDTIIGEADATGSTVVITASNLSDATYNLIAKQTFNSMESPASDPLEVVIDTVAPPEFSSTPPTTATVGQELLYDAQNGGAGGLTYSLANEPTGASIGPVNGVVSWTPVGSQVGSHQFMISASDVAGNLREQNLDISVTTDAKVSFRLELTDDQLNLINSLDVGDTFQLNVYAQDLRQLPEGVFAAFLDVLFDAQLVQVDGTITYGSIFPNGQDGTTDTPGLIDELGGVGTSATYGGEEVLLATVPMRALKSGEVVFTSDEPDDTPGNYVLVHGENTFVPPERIVFGTTSLTIDIAFGAVADTFNNIAEDSDEVTLDVLDNDEIFPGSTGDLTITDVDDAANGTVTVAQDGKSLIYKPDANFFGQEQFTYYVSDGTGTDEAVVTVNVSARNDDPTGVNDEYTIEEDDSNVELDVLGNDLITPDTGETLKITDVTPPSEGGFVDLPADGSKLTYTPKANFFGTETFTYTFNDGNGGTSTATVQVTVTEKNDPPQATNDLQHVDEDSGITTLDVLQNDDTAGDENETLTITEVSSPEFGGSVEIADDKLTLRYSPPANFFGVERFTYTISDGNGGIAQATVSMVVDPVNDPPTANPDDLDVVKDTTDNVLRILDNDTIAPDEGETLTVDEVFTDNTSGTVTISSDGQYVLYTPPTGFTGTDTFNYHLRDSNGAIMSQLVTVNVLEYIPSSLSGFVFLDVDSDGSRETSDSAVGGVIVTLTGTNVLGEQVDEERITNATGFYEFANLAPGDYVISEIQPEFLLDGVDSIGTQGGTVGNDSFTIELDQDTVGEENNFGERGREAKRISLSDFLSTTPRDSVLIASHAETGSTKWYAIEGGWIQAAELSAAITAETLHLDVEDTDDRMHYATISYTDIAQVRSMPGANGTLLARVVGRPIDLFQTAEFHFSNPDQPEGEADITPVGSLAEGEADAEGEATATLATMMHEPITVQTDAATEGATEDLMLVSPEAPTTGSLFDSPAEGEAKTVAQSTASIDSVLVEIGFEEDSDTVERLIEGMQEDEDDFAAAADELFGDLVATDEPQ